MKGAPGPVYNMFLFYKGINKVNIWHITVYNKVDIVKKLKHGIFSILNIIFFWFKIFQHYWIGWLCA